MIKTTPECGTLPGSLGMKVGECTLPKKRTLFQPQIARVVTLVKVFMKVTFSG